jgi:hypothetical protein
MRYTDDGPWLFGELGGCYDLGNDWRIGDQVARLEDVERALRVLAEDRRVTPAMMRRRQEELALLRPYLEKGMTVPEAVAAYRRDHEEAR